eukprot:3070087-Prymnesium_polylepis.2
MSHDKLLAQGSHGIPSRSQSTGAERGGGRCPTLSCDSGAIHRLAGLEVTRTTARDLPRHPATCRDTPPPATPSRHVRDTPRHPATPPRHVRDTFATPCDTSATRSRLVRDISRHVRDS